MSNMRSMARSRECELLAEIARLTAEATLLSGRVDELRAAGTTLFARAEAVKAEWDALREALTAQTCQTCRHRWVQTYTDGRSLCGLISIPGQVMQVACETLGYRCGRWEVSAPAAKETP